MDKFNYGWYLIYTKPRHEKKVHAGLAEKKIDAYLPLVKKLRTWHDRKKYIHEPLFPSYVFIYLNNMQSYYAGMDIDGALHYVKTGKEIARVSESVINNIKLAAGQPEDLEVCSNPIQAGKRLVISQGALTGLSCELVQYNDKRKLLVRVDLLQRNLLLSMPVDHLMAI